MSEEPLSQRARERTYRIMAYLSRVDGVIDEREATILEEWRSSLGLDIHRATELQREASESKSLRIGKSEAERSTLIRGIVAIVAADRVLDEKEKRRIRKLAKDLGEDPYPLVNRCRRLIERKRAADAGELLPDQLEVPQAQGAEALAEAPLGLVGLGFPVLSLLAGACYGRSLTPDSLYGWIYAFAYGGASFLTVLYLALLAHALWPLGLRESIRRAKFGIVPGLLGGAFFGVYGFTRDNIRHGHGATGSLEGHFYMVGVCAILGVLAFVLVALGTELDEDTDKELEWKAMFGSLKLFLKALPVLAIAVVLIPFESVRMGAQPDPKAPVGPTRDIQAEEIAAGLESSEEEQRVFAAVDGLLYAKHEDRCVEVLAASLGGNWTRALNAATSLQRAGPKVAPHLPKLLRSVDDRRLHAPAGMRQEIDRGMFLSSLVPLLTKAGPGARVALTELRRLVRQDSAHTKELSDFLKRLEVADHQAR